RENTNFESETARLIKVLAEGGVRQPVIVDNDKEVQESIVEQTALRIAQGTVPASLAGKVVLRVEAATLFSNMHSRDETAQAIAALVNDTIASHGQIILYVDELTNFVGDNAPSNDLFKGISEGKIVMIGGCSAA